MINFDEILQSLHPYIPVDSTETISRVKSINGSTFMILYKAPLAIAHKCVIVTLEFAFVDNVFTVVNKQIQSWSRIPYQLI